MTLDYLPQELLARVSNVADFARALVLDKWVCNADGRQALYVRKAPRRRRYSATLIDQDYCFNAGEWKFPDYPLRGVFANNCVYEGVTGWEVFEPALTRAEEMDADTIWRANGVLAHNGPGTFTGTDLLQKCCDFNVKLLWVASDNPPDRYITGFKARGKCINLVMTIDRNGSKFPIFREKLLFRMYYGDTMPVAWVDLCPQGPPSLSSDAPSTIFFAGRGGVRLP